MYQHISNARLAQSGQVLKSVKRGCPDRSVLIEKSINATEACISGNLWHTGSAQIHGFIVCDSCYYALSITVFVFANFLRPSQQRFSHVGTFPVLNQN